MTADRRQQANQVQLERAVQVILRAQVHLVVAPPREARLRTGYLSYGDTCCTASARQAGISYQLRPLIVWLVICAIKFGMRRQWFWLSGRGHTLACTAGGAYAAQLCGKRDEEWVQAAIKYLRTALVFNRRR